MTTSWAFGGTTLTTFGKVTLIDDYLSSASRRGDNQVIPFRHGSIHVKKYYDERTIIFGIAVISASATALEASLDALRAKLAPLTEQTLAMTMEDATVRNAQASVNSAIEVSRVTNTLARVTIEFVLSKPFFRLSTAIASTIATINASPKALVVTNPGTIEERDPIITLTGPLTNVVITNSTNGDTLTYTGAITGTDTVIIQTSATGEYTATHSVSGNVIGNVSHAGSTALMIFDVGANTLSITSEVATTGTVAVSFNAPFA